jgi:hypothetical protein
MEFREMVLKILLFVFIAFQAGAQELKKINAANFISQNPSPERKLLISYLTKQFEGRAVNLYQIDSLWNNKAVKNTYMLARFQIINQKLYADSFNPEWASIAYNDVSLNYYYALVAFFRKFVEKYQVPDVDFLIYLREHIPYENGLAIDTQKVPAFIMFKNLNQPYELDKFIFPDPNFLKPYWQYLLREITLTNKKILWENKQDKYYWRGGSTGDFLDYKLDNLDKLPRLKLTLLSSVYPDLIDAQLTEYVGKQFTEDNAGIQLRKTFKNLFGSKTKLVKEVDHLKYKYLLSLDGNSATGMRVPWIMNSNSVLVKQESAKIEWFYTILKPYVNYVPIKEDLSDIFDQYQWMQDNPEKIQAIISNANKFVEENLQEEHIYDQVAILLNEYNKIQQDKKIIATLPEVSDWTLIRNAMRMVIERAKDKISERIALWF